MAKKSGRVADDELQQVEVELMDMASTEIVIEPHQLQNLSRESLSDDDSYSEYKDEASGSNNPNSGKRLLLKDWLIKKLDSEELPDVLSWVNKAEGLFKIKWLHKATDCWQLGADGGLFKEWCMYTGKYDPHTENPRKWKANFRCALNSLPDVIIVPNLCVKKGKEAYRVFKILPEKIPEKVREKQESSRNRRRRKREELAQQRLLLAQAAQAVKSEGSAAELETQLAHLSKKVNMIQPIVSKKARVTLTTNIKPAQVVTGGGRSLVITKANGAKTTTSGGKATVLNGMDALCTAAAMMADTPGEEGSGDAVADGTLVEVVTTATPATTKISGISTPVLADIVTYYRPVGPIQLFHKDGSPAATILTTPVIATTPATVASNAKSSTQTLSGISLYRPVTPVKGVVSPSSGSTSTAGVLLNVKLAQPSHTNNIGITSTKVLPQGVTQIPGYPQGVCLTPVAPFTPPTVRPQTPTYLIPKSLLQKQSSTPAGSNATIITIQNTSAASTTSGTSNSSTADQINSPAVISIPGLELGKITLASSLGSGVKTKPDMTEYSQLKSSITAKDYNDIRFQCCKNSQYIRLIRLYDSDKPSVEVSVSVYPDYTYSIIVHNRNLPSSHEIMRTADRHVKSVDNVTALLKRVNSHVTCVGNPEDMPHQQYSDYTSVCSAYQEPDFGAKISKLRYCSTIRSNSCQLLIKAPANMESLDVEELKTKLRCDECNKIRTQILSMKGLLCLIDGDKVPDTEIARKKRLKLLQDFATKEVLANRIDTLESQIKQLKELIPSESPTNDFLGSDMMDTSVTGSTGRLSSDSVTSSVLSGANIISLNVADFGLIPQLQSGMTDPSCTVEGDSSVSVYVPGSTSDIMLLDDLTSNT